MSAHSPDVELRDHQPVQRAAPRADGPAHPVVRRLRPQPEVLHAAVRLGDQGDPLAELRELRHDLPRQVRLPRARHAGQQEAMAVEAVLHGILQGSCSVGGSVSSRGSWYSPSKRFTWSAPPRCAGTFAAGPDRPGSRSSAPPGSGAAPLAAPGGSSPSPRTPVAGLVPRFRITEGHGAGVAVEEGVVAVDAAGHGPLLPDGRLVAVEHLPAAVDDVQRRLAPDAELPDLGPGDALALPVLGANGVEVRVDLLVGQAQQLRELAHHAEPILPLLEGALQNFGAPEELW